MIKNTVFVNRLLEMAKNKTAYMWGGTFVKITKSYINEKVKQYPAHYSHGRVLKLTDLIGKDYFGCDCSGMIRSALRYFDIKYESKRDYELFHPTQKITDYQSIPKGALLWLKGHVGIYLGNNDVIECCLDTKGDGIVKTKTSDRKWLCWTKLDGIDYTDGKDYTMIKTAIGKKSELITTADLNLRTEPTTASASMLKIPKGDTCYLLVANVCESNGHKWNCVIYKNTVGYCAKTYLKDKPKGK